MTESYVPIPDASLAIGKPVTSTIGKLFRSNPIAIAQGHTDAERIWAQSARYVDFIADGNFPVPQGVRRIYGIAVGGGAGGLHNLGSVANVGGGAGGKSEGWIDVTPGEIIPITIGVGGIGSTSISNPMNGGTSSIGTYLSATGGKATVLMSPFEGSYGAIANRNNVIDLLQSAFNGGMGIGGEFNSGGSNGQIANYTAAQGGRGIGGFGGVSGDGVLYGDGASNGGVSNGYAGKHGIVRIYY